MNTVAQIMERHIPAHDDVPRDPLPLDPLDVDARAYTLRVNEAARRKVAQLEDSRREFPDVVPLTDFLAIDDPAAAYRIDRVWPVGGRVVLAAPNKAGKSTLVGNVLRSLADGGKFLDTYDTAPAKVVLLDNELDDRTLRRWLREHGIGNTASVSVVSLRGRVATFNVLDGEVRTAWARRLAGADVVILDCLRPMLDALGLDEHREAGRFLDAFSALLREADVGEALIVHHMGHGSERARGDSRILDWPDALWALVKDKQEDGELAGEVPRYFSAYGRDVDVSQTRLGYDALSRRLVVAGGSRKDARVETALEAVCQFLARAQHPVTKKAVEEGMEHARGDVRAAIRLGMQRGRIQQSVGARGAHMLGLLD